MRCRSSPGSSGKQLASEQELPSKTPRDQGYLGLAQHEATRLTPRRSFLTLTEQ